MILKKEICGDYTLEVDVPCTITLTDKVTDVVSATASVEDNYSFTIDDGIFTLVVDDGNDEHTYVIIEGCGIFDCVHKLIDELLCNSCDGTNVEMEWKYREHLNEFLSVLDEILLLTLPGWNDIMFGFAPADLAKKQASVDLRLAWERLEDFGVSCGCTTTVPTGGIAPYIISTDDIAAGGALLICIRDFLLAGQNELSTLLKTGYAYEVYGNNDSTQVMRLNMLHYLLFWMILYYMDSRNDVAWGEIYTDEEYSEEYNLDCIMATFRCENLNVRGMIQAFGLDI
jgi:hypothetical protein